MADQDGFRCTQCEKWHPGLPDLAFEEPLFVAELTDAERASRVREEGDFRVLSGGEDGTHYFVRGVLEVKVQGYPPGFGFGVWASLSEASYREGVRLYQQDAPGGPFFGWLSNRLPGFPETVGLKARSHFRARARPRIELEPTDHPLSVAQREGMSLEQAVALLGPYLHP